MDGLAANLFSRYNKIMRGTFLGVLLIAGCLFFVQLDQSDRAERALLENRLREHALALNFILKASADNVSGLQMQADRWYTLHPPGQPEPTSTLYRYLTGHGKNGFLTLDQVPPPFVTAVIGNLTGPARPLDESFHSEVEMALSLNSRFHTVGKLLPSAAWAYYTSGRAFINIYPWVPSSEFRYSKALLEKEYFSGGTPEKNPQRKRFWTKAYVDEAGKGLMVTVAAPVYEGPAFRGTVAIDLTLDELNSFVRTWKGTPGKGTPGELFVVNEHNQVLAHPRLVTSRSAKVPDLIDVLPADLRADADAVMAAANENLIDRAGSLLESLPLEQAPFRLVLVVPHQAMMLDILKDAGLTVFALLAGLALTLIISSRITLNDFIEPSQKLVDFIGRKLRGDKDGDAYGDEGIPAVPAAWVPWFHTIRNVFQDHTKLIAIQGELDIARTMQQSILPTRFPDTDEVKLFARMLPAKDVGGDFYDFFWLAPGLLGVVIADVSGKGVAAALFMAVARTLIRATAMSSDGPGACFRLVNNLLAEDNDTSMFVTVFYGVLDTATGELIYASAGHCPPCIVSPEGLVATLPGTGGMALGVIEDTAFAEKTVILQPGATLLLFTDGVSEAVDPADNEFTEARLRTVLAGGHLLDMTAFVNTVVDAVDAFAAGAPQADDLTCLALRIVAQLDKRPR
ncbi:MAG: SpoIIE family protein phosphatase [Rhodospirillaceae bacterium]